MWEWWAFWYLLVALALLWLVDRNQRKKNLAVLPLGAWLTITLGWPIVVPWAILEIIRGKRRKS